MSKFFNKSRGFTLIELLVVVAIFGILAAVVIPNIDKFIEGESEYDNVQAAVTELMEDKGLTSLSNPVTSIQATNNMNIFPEIENPLYPFCTEEQFTKYSYWVEIDGTVHR